MVEATFWFSLFLTVYVYAGYPLLLMVLSWLAPRRIHKRDITPTVSIIISIQNEQDCIARRVRNCLELDYPPEKLEIVVSLDGSDDGTAELLKPWESARVHVVRNPVRSGKAVAVNWGVAAARGEIVLLADARQRFAPDALKKLVANFADESVGAVSGELVLLDDNGRESADSVGAYWRYEKKLRSMESTIHSTCGTGAILAVRRRLFTPLQPGTVLDDVAISMGVVLEGKRAVFEPAARAYDSANLNLGKEYARKRRTLMGNYEIFSAMPELLAPWRNPVAWQTASHKAGRLLVPWCLAALFVSNFFLTDRAIYVSVFVMQIAFWALALAGWRFRGNKPARLAYTFALMNYAAVAGLFYFMREHDGIWEVTRPEPVSEDIQCRV